MDEEAEVKSKPKTKPEVKKKPQRKSGLFLPPMDGGTVEELGRYIVLLMYSGTLLSGHLSLAEIYYISDMNYII